MSNYGVMIERIKGEIRRPNMGPQIRAAIQSAITHYEGEHYFFNEGRATATTVQGTAFYTLPNDFMYTIGKEALTMAFSGRTIDLEQVEWDRLQQSDDGVTEGRPAQWAYFEEQFRLHPIPDGPYTMTLAYVKKLTDLNLDTDTNAWMVEAEEMVRHRAKADLYFNIIHDFEKAQVMASITEMAENRLRRVSGRKQLSGRVTGSYL